MADEDALLRTFVPLPGPLASVFSSSSFIYFVQEEGLTCKFTLYTNGQMAFSHPTNNNMVYVSTFLCPRRLFSAPIGSWLYWPQPRKATKLSLFQPPGVYKEPEVGQNHQSHLCCCLDNTSPRLAFTSTSAAASVCSMPRPEEPVPVSPCSCPPRGPQLFHSQVNFTSQEHARKCSVDFHPQVNFTSQERARKCTVDFHSQVTSLLTSSHSGRLATVARFSHCGTAILLL